jgi:hypothetical protein
LGRGRRRLHVFRRFPAVKAFESIDTHRAILSPTTNITRDIVKHSTAAMDNQCLHGIPFTKSLFGDVGIHDGCRSILQVLSRHDGKGFYDILVITKTGL